MYRGYVYKAKQYTLQNTRVTETILKVPVFFIVLTCIYCSLGMDQIVLTCIYCSLGTDQIEVTCIYCSLGMDQIVLTCIYCSLGTDQIEVTCLVVIKIVLSVLICS